MDLNKLYEVNTSLWDRYTVSFRCHQDVNIIVGINGSGKTTLLNQIYSVFNPADTSSDKCIYIPSVDNLVAKDGRKKSTALSQALDYYLFDMKTGPSLMYYRLSMFDAPDEIQTKVKQRIHKFLEAINSLFKDSRKEVAIDGSQFIIHSDTETIPLESLSSGEKQVLLILLRVFLTEEKESVILIDEPENSLDISWQYKLIDLLINLNPNAQFFVTTHSPSIFGDGWGDKIIYMEDFLHN